MWNGCHANVIPYFFKIELRKRDISNGCQIAQLFNYLPAPGSIAGCRRPERGDVDVPFADEPHPGG